VSTKRSVIRTGAKPPLDLRAYKGQHVFRRPKIGRSRSTIHIDRLGKEGTAFPIAAVRTSRHELFSTTRESPAPSRSLRESHGGALKPAGCSAAGVSKTWLLRCSGLEPTTRPSHLVEPPQFSVRISTTLTLRLQDGRAPKSLLRWIFETLSSMQLVHAALKAKHRGASTARNAAMGCFKRCPPRRAAVFTAASLAASFAPGVLDAVAACKSPQHGRQLQAEV
jgi:hypothetical protein